MIFDRLATGIQGHAKLVVAVWIVILLGMSYFAMHSGEIMSYNLNDMAPEDSESIIGLQIIAEEFPTSKSNENNLPILVLYFEDEDGMDKARRFVQDLNVAALKNPDIKLFTMMEPTPKETGDGIILSTVSLDASVNPVKYTPDLRAFIASVKADSGYTGATYLTGVGAIAYDMEHNSAEDISRIDPFTILMILILVGLFFRSFVTSAVPPMTIGFAFVVTMGLIFFVGHVLNVFYITNMMILVSMMGAGCDYCIFIISRYREELRRGLNHDDALHQAIVWAGESITISGASVIIGFGAMAICKYSMISSMGLCLALGILIALLAALTLIPAILQIVGDRIFWPTRMKEFEEGGKATKGWFAWFSKIGSVYFEKSSHFSLKHAKAIAVCAILVTVPAVYVVSESEDSYDMISSMLSGESGDGMDLLTKYADQGLVMPNYTVIQYDNPIATVKSTSVPGQGFLYWTDHWEDVSGDLEKTLEEVVKDENISYASGPFVWDEYVEKTSSITDPEERVKAIKAMLPGTDALYFAGITDTVMIALKVMGHPEILFDGYGDYIDDLVKDSFPGFCWDDEVAAQKAAGVTDPDTIVANIEAEYPGLNNYLDVLIKSGSSADVLVNGFGPMVDYTLNVSGTKVGGSYVETGNGDATYVKVTTATVDAAMSPRSMESIQYTDKVFDAYRDANQGLVFGLWGTGSAVIMYEVSEMVKGEFTLIEALVVILILILLFVVMRSYLIPVRSVLTILMSISWTLAATHLLFTQVLGEDVLWLVPILLLVICLGLGMDYDILLTTRIKENVMSLGMDNDEAIHHAVTHTGSVITICGLIMGGAFGTLMLSSMPLLQEIGFALCFAILVDALLVRTYIVPAIMHLLGDWNWKGPFVKRKAEKTE